MILKKWFHSKAWFIPVLFCFLTIHKYTLYKYTAIYNYTKTTTTVMANLYLKSDMKCHKSECEYKVKWDFLRPKEQ